MIMLLLSIYYLDAKLYCIVGRASYHVCENFEAQLGPKRCYEIWCGLAPLVPHLHL
jgi:hypothetical protein